MLGDITIADHVYIVTGYTDMRRSIDGLLAIIIDHLHMQPDITSIYLFCGKRCDRIKLLMKEPDGFVLLYKRLDSNMSGRFAGPETLMRSNLSAGNSLIGLCLDSKSSNQKHSKKSVKNALKPLILLAFYCAKWYNYYYKTQEKNNGFSS